MFTAERLDLEADDSYGCYDYITISDDAGNLERE